MNNLYFFQNLFQEIVLTGDDILDKVRIDDFIRSLTWF
jgi:hypothetical protein